MFRTAQPQELIDAARDAAKLHRFFIKGNQTTKAYMLWLWKDPAGWVALHIFPTQEAAEDYLHSKLAKIADTRGDITRPRPEPPPAGFWEPMFP